MASTPPTTLGPLNELLEIKAFNTTPEKVDRVVFHPVQPLIAYTERSSTVTVWNYVTNEVLYTNQMGGADDGALQELILWQKAEKEAISLGSQPSAAPSPAEEASNQAKSAASGAVQDLLFFDLDTCFWQIATQHSLQYGATDTSSIPSLGKLRLLFGHRWVATACDNKVTLHDLSSPASIDLPRATTFESKAPTRLALLLVNLPSLTGIDVSSSVEPELLPMLAVGTSGGSIYLINPVSGTVYAKLTGAHKVAITALVTLASEEPGGPDRLLSADASGTIAVWDPSRTPAKGSDREITAKRSFKAHESAIRSMSMYITYDTGAAPEALPPRLVTVGDDKKVALWDIKSWQCINRIQPLPKGACNNVGFAPWGGAGLGVHPNVILSSGESTVIMGLDPSSGDITSLLDIMGRVNPGQKKAPKIYHLAVHPTKPHLVAVGVNTGVGLLTFDANERPAVVALPPQILTLEALMQQESQQEEQQQDAGKASNSKKKEEVPVSRGASGFTYVMATGGSLWSTALRLESKVVKDGASERTVSLVPGAKEEIAKLDHPGRPILACSASGRSISAVWPEHKMYAVYVLAPTGTWEVIDRGAASAVVWSSVAPMYALITAPNVAFAGPKEKKGLLSALGFGTKKAEAEQDAMAAALQAAAAAASVSIHVVDESNASQFLAAHQLALNGSQPVALHGGALLGIVALHPVTLDQQLQFFSWKDFTPVGQPMPEPLWISWEPECTLAVLGYEHSVELCRSRPYFERFATLALSGTYAGIWQSRQLFVVSQESVHLVFADPVQEFVQEITLASFNGGVSSKMAPPLEATPLPPEEMRPVGPLTLAGVRHSYLWLADGFGRPFIISLRHPGIRHRCLAARGELTTARTIAERGLSPAFHDNVARFLAAMNPKEGVKEALLLKGLSPAAELALCIRDGNWGRAARSFQALAMGVSDKSLLTAALERTFDESGVQATASVADRIAGLTLGGSPGAMQSSQVERILEQHERGEEDEASVVSEAEDAEDDDNEDEEKEIPDPVDWDAALKPRVAGDLADDDDDFDDDFYNTEQQPSVTSSASGEVKTVINSQEAKRVAHVTELGIRFADAATAAGQDDAARSALGVLVGFAPVLPVGLLEDLICRFGQCKMTESARNLAVAAAEAPPGSPLKEPGVASLLAALIGGRHASVQDTLQAAGLAPLSAVYSTVWGQGSQDVALAHWKESLAGRVEIERPRA